jgi:hypothetical protein
MIYRSHRRPPVLLRFLSPLDRSTDSSANTNRPGKTTRGEQLNELPRAFLHPVDILEDKSETSQLTCRVRHHSAPATINAPSGIHCRSTGTAYTSRRRDHSSQVGHSCHEETCHEGVAALRCNSLRGMTSQSTGSPELDTRSWPRLDRIKPHLDRLGRLQRHHVHSDLLPIETKRLDHGPDNTFTPNRAVNLAATSAKSA